jgi:hypothetical protein
MLPTPILLLALLGCRPECQDKCGETNDTSRDTARGDSAPDTDDTDSAGDTDSASDTGDSGHDTAVVDTATTDSGDSGHIDTSTGSDDTGSGAPSYVEWDLNDADVALIGEEEGSSVYGPVAVGDFNGDGVMDALLGKEQSDLGGFSTGTTYVVHGPLTSDVHLSDADGRLIGVVEGGYAGQDGANAGDVDGDGIADILIGAPGPLSWDSPGQAYIVAGYSPGDLSLSDATAVLVGEYVDSGEWYYDYGYAGSSVAAAGDVNRDGYGDVLIGGYQYDSSRGVAYLVYGPFSGEYELSEADVRIEGESAGDRVGTGVDAGDADGDGVPDIFLSGSLSTGGVLMAFAAPHASALSPADASARFVDSSGNLAGSLQSIAGDLDGDGYEDYWLAAVQDDRGGVNAGGVYLLPGPMVGDLDETAVSAIVLGTTAREYAGGSVAPLGDVNGDAIEDILVGTYENYGDGSAYLVYGPFAGTTSLLDAAVKFYGDEDDRVGDEVLAPGDVDGDGLADLFISGPRDDTGGSASGSAWIMFSSSL